MTSFTQLHAFQQELVDKLGDSGLLGRLVGDEMLNRPREDLRGTGNRGPATASQSSQTQC